LRSDDAGRGKEFWKEKFKDKPRFELPLDFARPSTRNFIGRNDKLELDEELSKQVVRYASANNSSLFMFYSCVLSTFFRKYSDLNDIIFGIPMTLRDVGQTYNSNIGFFLNTLPIRINIDESIPFSQFLKLQTKELLAFYDNKHYPFANIIDDLNWRKEVDRNPLFNYMVVGIEHGKDVDVLAGFNYSTMRHNDNTSKFDLSFFIINSDGKLAIQIEYDVNLYTKETVSFFLQQIKNAMTQIIMNQEVILRDISFNDRQFKVKKDSAAIINENLVLQEMKVFQAHHVAAVGDVETKLFSIWVENLGRRDFGVTDNFFDIGGTSMKAIRLINNINVEFNTTLTIVDVFTHSNIRSFGNFILDRRELNQPQKEKELGTTRHMDRTLQLVNNKK
jgi:hypothetical protein